jgi:hypothetical protein
VAVCVAPLPQVWVEASAVEAGVNAASSKPELSAIPASLCVLFTITLHCARSSG